MLFKNQSIRITYTILTILQGKWRPKYKWYLVEFSLFIEGDLEDLLKRRVFFLLAAVSVLLKQLCCFNCIVTTCGFNGSSNSCKRKGTMCNDPLNINSTRRDLTAEKYNRKKLFHKTVFYRQSKKILSR